MGHTLRACCPAFLLIMAFLMVPVAWPSPAAGGVPPAVQPPVLPETMALYMRQSTTVTTPWPVTRVAVIDPKIADVQVLSPQEVLVMGKAVGSTDLVLWGEGERTQRVRLDVAIDLRYMESELNRLFPRARLELSQSQGVLAVRGGLERAEQAAELTKYLDAVGIKHVNLTSVAGVQQVMILVRVAEVSRVALRQLGINAFYTGRSVFGGSTVGGNANSISIGPAKGTLAGNNVPFSFLSDAAASPSVTLFGGFPKIDLEIFLQALTENQYVHILAEPNLMALNGEEATFLAGGSYPIPVVQGSTGGTTGSSITIQYQDYGVRLRFRPTVLGDGTIRLFVAPEVSELTNVGAVTIQGFTVPALTLRRAETTLQLRSGQTFAMAGLLKHTVNADSSRVPGLGELPVIGPLFRSVSYQKGETELVILVTPSLVEPLSETNLPPLPGALHVAPNDWELYCKGQIQGRAAPRLSPVDEAWLKKMGFTTLKGPGGWDSYDRGAAKSQATVRPAAEQAGTSEAKPGETPPTSKTP